MVEKMKKSTVYRLISYMKPRWPLYVSGSLGLSFFNLFFNYIAAIGLKYLTDGSINGDMGELLRGVYFMAAGFGVLVVVMPVLFYSVGFSVKKTTGDIRKKLFGHIQGLPVKEIEGSHSGDFISRLSNDVQSAENVYGDQILKLSGAIVSGIGSGIVIVTMSPSLAAFAVVLGILNVLVNACFAKPLKNVSTKAQESLSSLTQRLSDMLAGSQVVRLFGIKRSILDRFGGANGDIRKWSMKRVILNSWLGGANTLLGFLSFVGISAVGGIMVVNGRMSFGTLIAIDQMASGLSWMFSSIGNYITQLQASLAGAERIFEVLDKPVESRMEYETGENVLMLTKTGAPVVEFEDVDFTYEEDKKVLGGLKLKIYKDEVIAVVGSSGSGKSTIYKLLLGFYKTGSGSININGKPVSSYNLDELRGMFAYVPQDNYLYSGTIAQNIGYGKIGASMEQIVECAKAANAHDFIMEFPEGYNTEVGERGARLSGGQRQRIAIARALLKDAPILLLDEATSALDSESEGQVQKALEALMKGRTTIVVAHRLSTIQSADRILVLEDGRVCEEGDHETLMDLGNIYARLYNLQFKNAGVESA